MSDEQIRLVLFWDDGEWATEADDVDGFGESHDTSSYRIANPDDAIFANLDHDASYEAWGVRTKDGAVRVIDIGEPV